MTAVVEIAKERRASLAAELASLDDFIRMAEALGNVYQGSGRDPVVDAAGAAPGVPMADRGHDADLIGEDMAARDGVAVTVTTIEEPATIEDGVPDVSLQSDPARNKAGAQAIDTFQTEPDHFAFGDKASVSEDELVLVNPLSSDAAAVDVHVGQKIYQRRWMMGMTQRQLGELIGVKYEQIRKYEAGAKHISSQCMWDVAAAMEVPMSYFFEGIEGHAPDAGEARGDLPTDKEAPALASDAPRAQTAQAS
ncbi:MAG: helix-turn-helix domain-containing protein [Alphaproteobacteria bacterium]